MPFPFSISVTILTKCCFLNYFTLLIIIIEIVNNSDHQRDLWPLCIGEFEHDFMDGSMHFLGKDNADLQYHLSIYCYMKRFSNHETLAVFYANGYSLFLSEIEAPTNCYS